MYSGASAYEFVKAVDMNRKCWRCFVVLLLGLCSQVAAAADAPLIDPRLNRADVKQRTKEALFWGLQQARS